MSSQQLLSPLLLILMQGVETCKAACYAAAAAAAAAAAVSTHRYRLCCAPVAHDKHSTNVWVNHVQQQRQLHLRVYTSMFGTKLTQVS
jgi:hypothetical protein